MKVRKRKEYDDNYEGLSIEQRKWLENHTLADLEEIAERLEFQGENVDGIRAVIEDLTAVAESLGISLKSYADYDLLEFVGPEAAYA